MTRINTSTNNSRSPFGDRIISHNEVLLFCAAAFLLTVAYPFKEAIPPQAAPANLPVSDTTELVEQLQFEIEAQNTTTLDPAKTTVLLEPVVNSQLVVEIPASKPAS